MALTNSERLARIAKIRAKKEMEQSRIIRDSFKNDIATKPAKTLRVNNLPTIEKVNREGAESFRQCRDAGRLGYRIKIHKLEKVF